MRWEDSPIGGFTSAEKGSFRMTIEGSYKITLTQSQ